MRSVAIVIPWYKPTASQYEYASLGAALDKLFHYDHYLVVPAGLDIDFLLSYYRRNSKQPFVMRFGEENFRSVFSYNQLLLSPAFYRAFDSYEYILIYQPDAWIFRDELSKWIALGYDYVGAPWIDWIHASYHEKNKTYWGRLQWKFGRRRFDAVGNGGFSLRRVSTVLQILEEYATAARSYSSNEDFFFSFEVQRLGGNIRIPDVKQALKFAFDENPEKAFVEAGCQLPMGCHAWPRNLSFWCNQHTALSTALELVISD